MSMHALFEACKMKWGLFSQILMLAEESAELTQASLHLFRNIKQMNSIDRLAEEIADVEIMIAEIKYYFNLDRPVEEYKQSKIERLKKLCKTT